MAKSTEREQLYGDRHTPTCASGNRAESRGECDCGAAERANAKPWRVRAVDARESGMEHVGEPDVVEVVVDRVLSTREAIELALTLQNLTIQTAQRNVARRERDAEKAAKLAAKKLADERPPWERA